MCRWIIRPAAVVVIQWLENIVFLPVYGRVPFLSTVKPGPPVNLSHVQTIDAELFLQWDNPSLSKAALLRYEVRYSANASHPTWQVKPSCGGK